MGRFLTPAESADLSLAVLRWYRQDIRRRPDFDDPRIINARELVSDERWASYTNEVGKYRRRESSRKGNGRQAA